MTVKIRIELYPLISMNERGARCNLNCIWCHNDLMPVRQTRERNAGQLAAILESIDVLQTELPQNVPVQISAAGEPTLIGKDMLCRLVRGIRDRGFSEIGLTTNGTTGNKGLYDALSKAGLKEINISLNSLRPDRYAKYTAVPAGGSLFKRVLAAIDTALESDLVTGVNWVHSALNEDELDAVLEFISPRAGLTWKMFDLLGEAYPGSYRSIMPVLGRLREKKISISEREHREYAFYMLPVGRAWLKLKLSREENLCPNRNCFMRGECTEGCRASVRVSSEGIWPCGVRTDNHVPSGRLSDRKFLHTMLNSGGKLNWTTL